MNAPAKPAHLAPPVVDFELDGRPAQARAGETILQAADRLGVPIPRLCYTDGLRADGNCRACVVEIEGERTLAPSCCRAVQPGMKVKAGSERARKSQQMVLELLLADLPTEGYKWLDDDAAAPHGELSQWAAQAGVQVRPALQALRRAEPAPGARPAGEGQRPARPAEPPRHRPRRSGRGSPRRRRCWRPTCRWRS